MAAGHAIYGDGTHWQRKDGRWEGRVDLGIIDGKRRRKAVYGKTEKEVVKKLRDAFDAELAQKPEMRAAQDRLQAAQKQREAALAELKRVEADQAKANAMLKGRKAMKAFLNIGLALGGAWVLLESAKALSVF